MSEQEQLEEMKDAELKYAEEEEADEEDAKINIASQPLDNKEAEQMQNNQLYKGWLSLAKAAVVAL